MPLKGLLWALRNVEEDYISNKVTKNKVIKKFICLKKVNLRELDKLTLSNF